MNTWLGVLGAVLGALVSALTIGQIMKGILVRYTTRVFADDVMKALEAEAPRYREFHSKVFTPELDRGRRTADIAQGLSRDIQTHIVEFQRFRMQYEGHQEMLVMIPKTIVHLDESVKRLDRTLATIGDAMTDVREDVAYLKGRAQE